MKTILLCLCCWAVLSPGMIIGQQIDNFLDGYHFHKVVNDHPAGDTLEYFGITGNPYLDKSFSDALVYLKDSVVVKMPVRFNIYADVMEYRIDGIEYIIGDPTILLKIQLRDRTYEYHRLGSKSSYCEVLAAGKCALYLKRTVRYNPPEGPKAIEGVDKPASFTSDPDRFFLQLAGQESVEVGSLKAVLKRLEDHRREMDAVIEREKIKGMKRASLIRLIEFYNTL